MTSFEDFLGRHQKRLQGVLEDCCCLAGMGDFHQAALRFAEFRRALESSFAAEKPYAPLAEESPAAAERRITRAAHEQHGRALALTEEAWSWLTRSAEDAFIETCGELSAAVEELFRRELHEARSRLGMDPPTAEAASASSVS